MHTRGLGRMQMANCRLQRKGYQVSRQGRGLIEIRDLGATIVL
jgi:hypothetical protein